MRKVAARAVMRTNYTYGSIAICEGPEVWFHEGPDAELRREARKHAAETGHRTRIDWARSTVYDRELDGTTTS